MYQINNFTDNDDIRILDKKGPFTVIEYKRDLSVTPRLLPPPTTATR